MTKTKRQGKKLQKCCQAKLKPKKSENESEGKSKTKTKTKTKTKGTSSFEFLEATEEKYGHKRKFSNRLNNRCKLVCT